MRTRAHLTLLSLVLMALFVLVAAIPPSAANNRGGWHGGGRHHGGWRRSGWHGGWHGGFRGPRVYIGAPFWYPGPYAYPYPVYAPPVYAPPVYAPPVVEEPLPPAYVEPRSSAYWYYCQDPPGYYPYVASCAGGWQQVAPQPSPPAP